MQNSLCLEAKTERKSQISPSILETVANSWADSVPGVNKTQFYGDLLYVLWVAFRHLEEEIAP